MLAFLDVHYEDCGGIGGTPSCKVPPPGGTRGTPSCEVPRPGGARAACLLCDDWGDACESRRVVAEIETVAPYQSGQFWRRELPCLLQVLAGLAAQVLIVDGHVWLQPGQPGLGWFLHEATRLPVIGVAKNPLPGGVARPVLRGRSGSPLWVTSTEKVEEAVASVARMHGPFRLPTLLKRVDQLSRGWLAPS